MPKKRAKCSSVGGGSQHASFSGETAKLIDSEVRSIIDQCYATAKQILTTTATSWMPWLMR
jgi:ATP-dependent Zn protease